MWDVVVVMVVMVVMVVVVVVVVFPAGASASPQARKPVCPLLISELMPDPDPPAGLPPFEYAEWFNAGTDTVDLQGWRWVVGESVEEAREARVNQGISLGPGEYLIVCSRTALASFSSLGRSLVLESFPVLRNSGDRVTLVDPEGRISHTVYYSPDLIPDAIKRNGGWSLELSDTGSPCPESAWMPSADPRGGTPGQSNSLHTDFMEEPSVQLLRAGFYDSGRLFCLFSGSLAYDPSVHDYSCILQPGDRVLQPTGSPVYGFPGLFFTLPVDLDENRIYTLEIEGIVVSCQGSPATLPPVQFAVPRQPDSAGIVINEIMFDPGSGNPEWIELFNRGTVTVDLQKLIMARASPDGTVIGFSDRQPWSFLLFPGGYAVMAPSFRQMIRVYPDMDPGSLAERSDFPSLANDESVLILFDADQQVIDRAIYDPDWHYPYLDETTGVSLERIDPDASGLLQSNWFSASSGSSCTPGRLNSQSLNRASPPLTTPHIALLNSPLYVSTLSEPEPLVVHYTFPEPGWFCGLSVYDSRGSLVCEPLPFSLAGLQGVMTWDGLDGQSRQVPDGIYLLVARYRHPSGKMGRWKKACAVVRVH